MEPNSSLFPNDESTLLGPESPTADKQQVTSSAGGPGDSQRSDVQDSQSSYTELPSTQHPTIAFNDVSQYFPVLGPAPDNYVSTLKKLVDLANESYLKDSDGSQARLWVNQLPSFLNATVQILSRLTGSYISARSVSYDYAEPSALRVYSTVTSDADAHIGDESAKEEIAYFAHEVCAACGPFLERASFNCFPTVYSSPDWHARPVLPPPHSLPEQLHITLGRYLHILRGWQDLLELNLDSIGVGCTLEDRPVIAASRLPSGLTWDMPFSQWPASKTTMLYMFIFASQAELLQHGSDAEQTALQWIEKSEDEPFRRRPELRVPIEDLYTTNEAAYFKAMAKHKFPPEAYFLLSPQPYSYFSDSLRQAYSYLFKHIIKEMADHIEINDKLNPPQAPSDMLTHPLLQLMPDKPAGLVQAFSEFQVPPAVYNYTYGDHEAYSVYSVYKLVCRDRIMVRGDMVLGGPFGIFRIGCYVLLMAQLIEDMAMDKIPKERGRLTFRWDSNKGQYLEDIIHEITNSVKHSISKARRPKLPPGTQKTPWRPERLRYTREGHESTIDIPWPYGRWGTDDPYAHSTTSALPVSRITSGNNAIANPQPQLGSASVVSDQLGTLRLGATPVNKTPPGSYDSPSQELAQIPGEKPRPRPKMREKRPAPSDNVENDGNASEDSGDDVFSMLKKPRQGVMLNPFDHPDTEHDQVAKSSAPRRPATDKAKTRDLPTAQEPGGSRRARSADAKPITHMAQAPEAGNALGLDADSGMQQPAHSPDTLNPTDLTSTFAPETSSTPHRQPRPLVRTTGLGAATGAPANLTSSTLASHSRAVSVPIGGTSRQSTSEPRVGLNRPVIPIGIGKGYPRGANTSTVPKKSSPLASPITQISPTLSVSRQGSNPRDLDEGTLAGSNLAFAAAHNQTRRSATPSSSHDRGLATAVPPRHNTRAVSTAQKRAHESHDSAGSSSGAKRARSDSRDRTD